MFTLLGVGLFVIGGSTFSAVLINAWWSRLSDDQKIKLWSSLPDSAKMIVPRPHVKSEWVQREESGQVVIQAPIADLMPAEQKTYSLKTAQVGFWVEWDMFGASLKSRLKITGKMRFNPQDFLGKGQFKDRQEPDWEIYLLDGGRFYLMNRPDGWYVFTEQFLLTQDEVRLWYSHGNDFSDKGQQALTQFFNFRSIANGIDWRLGIQDVGYFKVVRNSQDGISHLENDWLVKFMVAKIEQSGQVVFLEDTKDNENRVWLGQFLGADISLYLGSVSAEEK